MLEYPNPNYLNFKSYVQLFLENLIHGVMLILQITTKVIT